jgi:hypothetical protein
MASLHLMLESAHPYHYVTMHVMCPSHLNYRAPVMEWMVVQNKTLPAERRDEKRMCVICRERSATWCSAIALFRIEVAVPIVTGSR